MMLLELDGSSAARVTATRTNNEIDFSRTKFIEIATKTWLYTRTYKSGMLF